MDKQKLYESIMDEVSIIVKNHLNEISSNLVNRAINKAEERLKEKNIQPKIRKGLNNQLKVFKKYKSDNFTWEQDYEFLVDAIQNFYSHIDSDIVQEFLEDFDYDQDEVMNAQYDINWNNIKNIMIKLYKYLNQYNWDNSLATRIEYLTLVYLNIKYRENWYTTSWAEEDYPETDYRDDNEEFSDYGDMLAHIKKNYRNLVISLFSELPKELLDFINEHTMDFFYESNCLYE